MIKPSEQIFTDIYMSKKIFKNVRIVDMNMK